MKKLLFTLFILTASCLMLLTACTECEVCSFGDWETVTEATCTAEGEQVRICSECQKEDRQPIEKKEHDLSLKETTLAATCTTEGKETWGCANCDYTEERTVKATGHKETKTVIVEATCTQEGKNTYTCSVCNNVRETTNAKISHRYTDTTCKKPATCTVCGATTGSKAEHAYSGATCTEPGKCTYCGKSDGKPLGHNHSTRSPYACIRCGSTDVDNIKLPSVPTTISYSSGSTTISTCKITSIKAEIDSIGSYSGYSYKITLSGSCTYHYKGNNQSSEMKIGYKLYDSDGAVVKSGTAYTESVAVGESFKETITLSYDLSSEENYKLVFLNVN